jgi:predicted HicB family RNase H-like nuclease
MAGYRNCNHCPTNVEQMATVTAATTGAKMKKICIRFEGKQISVRLRDELVEAIDKAAAAEGITRSRWVANLMTRELGAESHSPKRPRGETVKCQLRIDAPVMDAIDVAADNVCMKRNQWVVNVLTSRVLNKDGEILLPPIARQKSTDQGGQLLAVGRKINQAVHAINSAVMPDSGMNLVQCVNHLLAMRDELEEAMTADRISLLEMANTERRYWRGESSDA